MKKGRKLPNSVSMDEFINLPLMNQHIFNLRNQKGYTQKEVANAIGVTDKTYRSWEKNGTGIEMYNLLSLADFYKVSVDYLLGRSEYTAVENELIGRETGLSDSAINALKILHCPADASTEDSSQIGRYDIIALNLILEDFYSRYENAEHAESRHSFGDETRTALDCIGKYIDADSVSNPPLIKQNGVTSLYNPREVARQIAENNLHDCLRKLHDDYSLAIKQRKKENADYFHGLFKNEIEKTLQETRREK